MTTPTTFQHEALFYAGDDQFVARCRAFVEEGLERDEPVLVMVGSRKLELLRQALGERADDVHFADMEVIGRNPARIIPAWGRFVADHAANDGGGTRGIGEPIWADRKPDELDECQLHESLINLAFAAADAFRLICPYDTAALPDDVIAEARRSHPIVALEGPEPSRRLLRHREGGGQVFRAAAGGARGSEELRGLDDCARHAKPRRRAHARRAGRPEPDDLALAVNEVLSNSLHHARRTARSGSGTSPTASSARCATAATSSSR